MPYPAPPLLPRGSEHQHVLWRGERYSVPTLMRLYQAGLLRGDHPARELAEMLSRPGIKA